MTEPKPPKKPDVAPTDRTGAVQKQEAVVFEELARGAKEVLIEHHGQTYRLRATRNGGLILNK
jgi:hemin uptake protein HemP